MRMKIVAVAILLLSLGIPISASTYSVNNLGDTGDATPGDNICDAGGGICTLRAALDEANAHTGSDTIVFSVAGVITTASPLPVNDVAIIDGTTAPGYAGAPKVHIDGGSTVPFGLLIGLSANSSVVTALEVSGYTARGVVINGNAIAIQRCYIGPITQGGPNAIGIEVTGSNDLIGGNDGSGNVISGNIQSGILVTGSSTTISDNFIGTNAAGTAALSSGGDGIEIRAGASNTQIGATSANAQNVISGNGRGISLFNAQSVTVAGNFIGTDASGTSAIANGVGMDIFDSANSTIGTSGGRNVISGNQFDGIGVSGNSPGTVIDNNYIGTDVTGNIALPNEFGIELSSPNVTIGTTTGNVISGNTIDGIFVAAGSGGSPANFLTIANNIIGLDAAGVSIVGNGNGIGGNGIDLCCTTTSATIAGNVISGNDGSGINLHDAASNVTIRGNIIGLRKDGSAIRGNGAAGIFITGGSNLTIGGTTAAERNIISGNSGGILTQSGTTSITISGNYIGTDVTGLISLGNLQDGVDIFSSPGPNTVTANVISGNGQNGIRFDTTSATTLTNNLIGRNAANSAFLGNGKYGVDFEGGSNNTLTGNTIAANTLAGLHASVFSDGNIFADNSYFSNGGLGIDLDPSGVNPNDAQDGDTGANSRQNFPVISYATQVQIGGTINSNPNTTLTIDLYSNATADASGFGEGETHLLGNASVTTDGNGDASFIVFYGSPIPLGRVITGTATGPHGTSEFSQANVTVVAPPVLQFSSATSSVAENAGSAVITVTRTGETNSLVTVQYSTSPGTATAGSDYVPVVGTLAFGPGVTSQTFSVPINNDTIDEPDETLTLALSNPGSASLGLSSATLTINDDDPVPSITINNVQQAEGNSGTSNMTFTVTLSNPSASTITVDFATADGSAIAGADYITRSGTLTFNPGVTSQQVNVLIIGDTTNEPDETFVVNLSNGAQGTGTILNDDFMPIPTLSQWMLLLLAALLSAAALTRWKA